MPPVGKEPDFNLPPTLHFLKEESPKGKGKEGRKATSRVVITTGYDNQISNALVWLAFIHTHTHIHNIYKPKHITRVHSCLKTTILFALPAGS